MPVRPEFDRGLRGGNGLYRALDRYAATIEYAHAARRQFDDVAFLEKDEAVGDAGERECVGGEKAFAVLQADDER